MIRFLQSKDNRLVKAIFIVIIGAAVITMVVTLIPGIFQDAAVTGDTYATVFPHWYSRFTFTGEKISMARVQEIAQQQMQRQRLPEQYAAMFMPQLEARAGQQLILQKILLAKAASLGIVVNDEDVRSFIRTNLGQYFFPNDQWVGDEKYKQIVYQLTGGLSVADFEKEVQDQIAIQRLRSLITAGVTVSNSEVRDLYLKQNVKIKFDYAVISSDDLRKQINPTDAELQAYFSRNAARYANAVPEERKITYFAFTPDQIPGGAPKATEQEVQAYYTAHQAEYQAPEQARSRHILIKYPGGAAKSDAEAKAKAEALLKQIKAGADFADLAKKNSEDPGSGAQGGELGFAKRGTMVPEFDSAIFSQNIGDTGLVHTQYGYHIIQVEERQTAHTLPLSEVAPSIQVTLIRQKDSQAEAAYAQTLASEAAKNGLAKTAAAHHFELVTTPSLNAQGVIAGLPDGSQVVAKAFGTKQGTDPVYAPTGEGYAIFQVTGITPPHAPAFADWKSKVASDYIDERLPQLLTQKTKELADKAHASGDLAKAAKELGATVKTSDLVGGNDQVPDFGQVGSIAPDLLNLDPGAISGPINAQRTGVVAKIIDKVKPTPEDVAKNLDQAREEILDQRKEEVFGIYVSAAQDQFKKSKLIQLNAKAAKNPALPGE
jgi:peptidyl-prolyl cis-trans isomerase D